MFAKPRGTSKGAGRGRTNARAGPRSYSCEPNATVAVMHRKDARTLSRSPSHEPHTAAQPPAYQRAGSLKVPHTSERCTRSAAGLKITVGASSLAKSSTARSRLSESADSDCSTTTPEDTSSEESVDSENENLAPRQPDLNAATSESAPIAPVRPTSASESAPVAPVRAKDTAVIIFDWDDTLLPTSFFDGLPQIPSSAAARSCNLPFFVALRRHAKLVEETLRAARAVACVSIVTLAKRPWVMQSAERYLIGLDFPALVRELDITIYYATEHTGRPDVPPQCLAQDYTAWKRNAMAKCLTDWYATGQLGKARLNVTSIGDSVIEQQALKDLLNAWGQTGLLAQSPLCKTVKLMDHPTLSQLSDQLQRLGPGLECMAFREKAFDICVDDPVKLTNRLLASCTGA